MLPLKTKDGEEQLVIKTAAFNKDLTPRTIQNEKIRFFCERLTLADFHDQLYP